MQNIVLALSLLAASPAAPAVAHPATIAAPAVTPLTFFEGRSNSIGQMRVIFDAPRTVRAESNGILAADGALTLTQQIDEQGKPPRTRIFRLRQMAPGRYAGTLSDASGPVTGEGSGNRLRLRYRMAGGLRVDQRLTLSPDRRAIRSRINVYRMGMLVGSVRETISRRETVPIGAAAVRSAAR